MAVALGARWDDPAQDARMARAHAAGEIDYVEVNYPIPHGADPHALGISVLAHTSANPTCSVHGISRAVAQLVKDGADRSGSPWIGEHLTWLGAAPTGSLGYQINPLFTREFQAVAADNVRRLEAFYGRPVALELSPVYVAATGYESEMHFLADVAVDADVRIILDVTHWQIANRNLGRPESFGLDALPLERVVELHVAGMRRGSDGYWHDAHRDVPGDDVLSLVSRLVPLFPALEAVTLEHHAASGEDEFHRALERLDAALDGAREAA